MALNRLALDTTAYSHFQRGDREAVAAITTAHEVLVPTVTLGELRTGFRLSRRSQQNEHDLGEFLRHAVVRVVDVDDDVSAIYAEIVVTLRQAGQPIPTNDVWIAACAARHGAAVLSYDAHFQRIARVSAWVLKAR